MALPEYNHTRPVKKYVPSRELAGPINVSGGVSFEFKNSKGLYNVIETENVNNIYTVNPCFRQKYTKFPVDQANQFLKALQTSAHAAKLFPVKIKYTLNKESHNTIYDSQADIKGVSEFVKRARAASPTSPAQALSAYQSALRGAAVRNALKNPAAWTRTPEEQLKNLKISYSKNVSSSSKDPSEKESAQLTQYVDNLLASTPEYAEVGDLRDKVKKITHAYKSAASAGLSEAETIATELGKLSTKINEITSRGAPAKEPAVAKLGKRKAPFGYTDYAFDASAGWHSPRNAEAKRRTSGVSFGSAARTRATAVAVPSDDRVER